MVLKSDTHPIVTSIIKKQLEEESQLERDGLSIDGWEMKVEFKDRYLNNHVHQKFCVVLFVATMAGCV